MLPRRQIIRVKLINKLNKLNWSEKKKREIIGEIELFDGSSGMSWPRRRACVLLSLRLQGRFNTSTLETNGIKFFLFYTYKQTKFFGRRKAQRSQRPDEGARGRITSTPRERKKSENRTDGGGWGRITRPRENGKSERTGVWAFYLFVSED